MYARRVRPPTRAPCQTRPREKARENRGSSRPRGALSMTPSSTGSMPRARAGRESVTRFSHKSCTGVRGDSRKGSTVAAKMARISPMLQESK